MEANLSRAIRVTHLIAGCVVVSWLVACATPRTGSSPSTDVAATAPSPGPSLVPLPWPGPVPPPVLNTGEVYGPPEPFGPPARFPDQVAPSPVAESYGPAPRVARSVVLVLGPGMARGYAHAGVLRALDQSGIPVAAVIGTEFGGLIGSLYAVDGNINRFEWAMLRFREEVFLPDGGLFSGLFPKGASPERLEDELRKVFEHRDISQSRIPLRIAVLEGDKVQVLDRGELAEAVRAAVAVPGLFPPARFEGGEATSAGAREPFAIDEARKLGLGPVVAVDVLNRAESDKSAELREADLVLRPDVGGVGFLEFRKRADAEFRGKAAVQAKLDELRKLVGMQEGQ